MLWRIGYQNVHRFELWAKIKNIKFNSKIVNFYLVLEIIVEFHDDRVWTIIKFLFKEELIRKVGWLQIQ